MRTAALAAVAVCARPLESPIRADPCGGTGPGRSPSSPLGVGAPSHPPTPTGGAARASDVQRPASNGPGAVGFASPPASVCFLPFSPSHARAARTPRRTSRTSRTADSAPSGRLVRWKPLIVVRDSERLYHLVHSGEVSDPSRHLASRQYREPVQCCASLRWGCLASGCFGERVKAERYRGWSQAYMPSCPQTGASA